MRIICLEEHLSDPTLAANTGEALAKAAPYLSAIGSRYQEPKDLPRLLFVGEAVKLSKQPLAARLSAMDEAGIDHQVVSLGDAVQLLTGSDAPAQVREANNRLAEAVHQHPERFSAFFALPWQHPEAAAREAERCVVELGLPATMLVGRPQADCLVDDARFAPVLEALARLNAPLYIHPGPPLPAVQQPYYGGFEPEVTARLSLFGWGWHHEAGIQVIRLILLGALDRYRNLRLISGHWGEMVPFFLQRLDDALPPPATGLSRTISATYRDQVWVGPSGMLNTPHFLFVREVLGIERLVFSVDYPYLKMDGARAWLESLPIPRAEKEAFAHLNAESLLQLARPTSRARS